MLLFELNSTEKLPLYSICLRKGIFQENINFVPKKLDFSSYLRNATISMEFHDESATFWCEKFSKSESA